jgi:type IV secretion system protein VirB4
VNRKKSILSDLIPITAHYDTSTLITKNGELVQILSIRGFSKRFDKTLQLNLRNEVRKILKSLISKDIMFYLYVKRDYRKIDVSKEFTSEFARMKHEMWIKENSLDRNLMNTLYIAVVHMGAKQSFSKSKIFQQLFFNNMRSAFVTQLEKCSTELSKISDLAESRKIWSRITIIS